MKAHKQRLLHPYYFSEPVPNSLNGIVPLILRTVRVRLPNGEVHEVNRFDFNLMTAAKATDYYIQLSNLAWIRFGNLTFVGQAQDEEGR
ncbi:hypothetical protein LCGC14_1884310 [marine sediment metagenome]|uniref:Uncharacterized protein n=1 Tax=marine sediment metagenome TaxID=412755 RepID=A0A0F9GPQ7_9ZZZZ